MTFNERILRIYEYKNHGYSYAVLSKNGKNKKFKLHRLIGFHFIPNPCNYPQINHINAIRNDNRIENLEWCTHSHNMKHKFIMGNETHTRGKNPWAKPIADLQTGIFYDCIMDLAEALNINRDKLYESLRKRNSTQNRFVHV